MTGAPRANREVARRLREVEAIYAKRAVRCAKEALANLGRWGGKEAVAQAYGEGKAYLAVSRELRPIWQALEVEVSRERDEVNMPRGGG